MNSDIRKLIRYSGANNRTQQGGRRAWEWEYSESETTVTVAADSTLTSHSNLETAVPEHPSGPDCDVAENTSGPIVPTTTGAMEEKHPNTPKRTFREAANSLIIRNGSETEVAGISTHKRQKCDAKQHRAAVAAVQPTTKQWSTTSAAERQVSEEYSQKQPLTISRTTSSPFLISPVVDERTCIDLHNAALEKEKQGSIYEKEDFPDLFGAATVPSFEIENHAYIDDCDDDELGIEFGEGICEKSYSGVHGVAAFMVCGVHGVAAAEVPIYWVLILFQVRNELRAYHWSSMMIFFMHKFYKYK